jgi:hypothetical protein
MQETKRIWRNHDVFVPVERWLGCPLWPSYDQATSSAVFPWITVYSRGGNERFEQMRVWPVKA